MKSKHYRRETMLSKVITIISYLPDDEEVRKVRFSKLKTLLNKCNEVFDIPIFILIQNYKKEEIEELSEIKNVTLSRNYGKLGITGARKKIREKSLATTPYDYFILIDDDGVLEGTREGGRQYLETIDKHPGGYANFKNRQLKLFAISREVYSKVDYFDINPEDGVGFEDTIFIAKCDDMFREKRFNFDYSIELRDHSPGACDIYSTWWDRSIDMGPMLIRTRDLINKKVYNKEKKDGE